MGVDGGSAKGEGAYANTVDVMDQCAIIQRPSPDLAVTKVYLGRRYGRVPEHKIHVPTLCCVCITVVYLMHN